MLLALAFADAAPGAVVVELILALVELLLDLTVLAVDVGLAKARGSSYPAATGAVIALDPLLTIEEALVVVVVDLGADVAALVALVKLAALGAEVDEVAVEGYLDELLGVGAELVEARPGWFTAGGHVWRGGRGGG